MTSLFAPISLIALRNDIEAGRTTPAREIDGALARIAQLDPALRCFVRFAPSETIEAARQATGPLRGITLGIKDIFDTADMASEYGSPIYAGHQPRSDASLVAAARSLGAAIIGKTVTTEFAFLNPAPTRNPHDPAHTPGGSSSGSAAAVASGLVAGAFATQTAGSTIRPASFCGIAGFKPSFRLLSTVGIKPFAPSLDTAGLLAAGVRDVAMLATLLTGRDLNISDLSSRDLRVGIFRSAIDDQLDPAMATAWNIAARALVAHGVRLVDVHEPDALGRARKAQSLIQGYEGALSLLDERMRHSDALSPLLREALEQAAAVTPEAYDDARRTARNGRRAAASLFEACDVLLAPSAPGAAPRSLATTGDPAFNRVWTLIGAPCVNVPGLYDAAGMPLGLTVVGRFGRDRTALAAAAILEDMIRGS